MEASLRMLSSSEGKENEGQPGRTTPSAPQVTLLKFMETYCDMSEAPVLGSKVI
jgi:hypothetical protein